MKPIIFALAVVLSAAFVAAIGLNPAMAKDYIYLPVNNALQIIDCEKDVIVDTIPYNDYILTAAFSPDGKRYYLNAVHSIHIIDTDKNQLIDTLKLSSELSKVDVLGFNVSPDGKNLYLACSIVKKKQDIPKLNVLPPQLVVYNIQSKKILKSYPIPAAMSGVVTLNNDHDHIILAGLDVHKLNLKTGKLEKLVGMQNPAQGEEQKNALVVWQNNSPGDHGLFTTPVYTPTSMSYLIVDRNTGKIESLPGKDVLMEYSTIVTPDKKYMFGVMDELVKIDLKTGQTIKKVTIPQGTCYCLSMTSDGKKIYVGPSGADVSVYNTETLDLIGVIALAGDGVAAHRLSK